VVFGWSRLVFPLVYWGSIPKVPGNLGKKSSHFYLLSSNMSSWEIIHKFRDFLATFDD